MFKIVYTSNYHKITSVFVLKCCKRLFMTNKGAFFNGKSLKNRIIYSDTLNETEFLRTLAKQGINTLGVRVMNAYDLSLFILSKLGISEKRRYLNNKEQDFVYYTCANTKVFGDASNIRSAINSFRDTFKGNKPEDLDPLLDGNYKEKHDAIISAFKAYFDYKQKNKCYDQYDLLYDLNQNPQKLDDEIYYFDDLPFSELALSVFKNYFSITVLSFASLLETKDNNILGFSCFGKNNEIANVVNKINNKLKLDQCLVVLVNSNDAVDLTSAFDKFQIPYTSSLGIPFSQTNVGRLILTLKKMEMLDWGIDAYKVLFDAPYFSKDKYTSALSNQYDYDNFLKYTGWLRPSFDKSLINVDESLYQREFANYQAVCEAIQLVCNGINNGSTFFDFVKNNVVEDDHNFEALQLLKQYQTLCAEYGVGFKDIADALLSSTISKHISKSGAIHICSLEQAFSSIRENVFVIGLDSDFPGNPKENYLIFDEEYLGMGAKQYTSTSVVKKKEALMNLLIKCAKNGYLSYAYYNTIDTKASNPSSVLMNIPTTEFTYEDDLLTSNHLAIQNYNDGKLSKPVNGHSPYAYQNDVLLNKVYSPSKIVDFFDLEKRLKFFLEVLFDVFEDEEDDPYSVINAIDKGNLFHRVVMYFDKKKYPLMDAFVNKGLQAFDEFLLKKPPITKEAGEKERELFKKALINFYTTDPGNKCLESEKRLDVQEIEEVKFKGKLDRLEVDKLGNIILVDYKTNSSKPSHEENDPITCIQGLIYAEMVEQQLGKKVQRVEFRYPFIPTSIQIACNKINMDEMHNLIKQFKDVITNGDFDIITEYGKQVAHKYINKYTHLVSLMKELTK